MANNKTQCYKMIHIRCIQLKKKNDSVRITLKFVADHELRLRIEIQLIRFFNFNPFHSI